jgi:hypothetical protein
VKKGTQGDNVAAVRRGASRAKSATCGGSDAFGARGESAALREERRCFAERPVGGLLLQCLVAATDSWAMRRRVTGRGLLQAYASVLALCFGAGALLVGGPRASTWAILSLVMAATLLVGRLAPQAPSTGSANVCLRDGFPARSGSPRLLASRLVELLEGSRSLPLFRHQVQMNKSEVYELVAAIRHAAADDPAKTGSPPAVLAAAKAIRGRRVPRHAGAADRRCAAATRASQRTARRAARCGRLAGREPGRRFCFATSHSAPVGLDAGPAVGHGRRGSRTAPYRSAGSCSERVGRSQSLGEAG